MSKPKLLDLFCGAGGAAMGYHRAGFEVVGVDIKPQPRYPFSFLEDDALMYLRYNWSDFDAIHASPPCQLFIRGMKFDRSKYSDLLTPTRAILKDIGKRPWVIENVPGAPMRPDVILCGSQFGLKVIRHRWFETSFCISPFVLTCNHPPDAIGCYGHGSPSWNRKRLGRDMVKADYERAMGIDWMNRNEITQAIPPAYTEWIGKQIIQFLQSD